MSKSETFSRSSLKRTSEMNLGRKAYHVVGVFIIIAIYNLVDRVEALVIAAGMTVLTLSVDLARQRYGALNQWVMRLYGPIMRQREFKGLTGMSFALLGVMVLVFFFPQNVATHALLFLAVGDPVASYWGLLYGKDRLAGRKTLQGSLAAFVACTLLSAAYLLFMQQMTDRLIIVSLIAGLAGAAAELISIRRIDDNFSMPVMSACCLWLIYYFFGGGAQAF